MWQEFLSTTRKKKRTEKKKCVMRRRRTRRACPSSSSSSDCDAKQKQQVVVEEEDQRTREATATAEEELAAINSLTRDQVRVQLRRRGRRTSGLKSQLVKRLREAILEDQQKEDEDDINPEEEENAEEQQSTVREETPLEKTAEQESDKMGKKNKRQQRKPKPTQRNNLKKDKEERHIIDDEEEEVQTVQIEKQKEERKEEEEAERKEEAEEEKEEEEETELDEILQAATLSLNKHLQTMTKGGGDAGERGSSISQEFQRIRERNRSHTTKLQSGLEDTELYLTPKTKAQLDEGRRGKAHNEEEEEEDYHSGKLRTRTAVTLQVGSQVDSLLKESLIPALHKRETAPPLDSRKEKKKEKKPETAGRGWFDLPAPEMTAELKRDLQMIRLRNYMDPKQHYKRIPKRGPKYFQIGTIVDGPTDFYSSRVPKRDRKRTIVEEVMADEQARQWAKRKFSELQRSKQAAGRKKTTPKKKSKQSHRT
ncbi:Deoxynucleotidyltransferase terminal-interacting protein 2 [Balamuthia mandrillaris]